MNDSKTAKLILQKIGGKDNIISAAHCATRLRLVIADNSLCSKKELEDIEGVKGVFEASGQLQIILGTGVVNKVFDEFIKETGIKESTKEEVKNAAASKQNFFLRLIKVLGDIFVPIIPAIVASGFLMGIMEAMNFMVNNGFLNINTDGSIYQFAVLFSNVAYTFLPILIAFSAAKVFGANPYLGAVIGMIMIHPNLQNAWSVATEGVLKQQPVFFGLYKIDMIGYQGHVIPVVIAVFLLAVIEKRLHKIVPSMLDLFLTPLISVFVTGYLTLAAIGPVFVAVENGLLNAIQWLLTLPLGIGSLLMGGAYATTVVSGIHHMYTIIDLGQIAQYGLTFWLPLASAANVAQGGAALAVAFKSKNKKIKALAFPSALSAFMGITEPAIFGVNLRFLKPFVAGSIGAACGAWYASIVNLGATGTGVTGIFGILLHLHRPLQYLIAMGIAIGVSFVLSFLLYHDKKEEEPSADSASQETLPAPASESSAKTDAGASISSPLTGKILPTAQIQDETFAGEMLGKTIGIVPEEGEIFSPCDGTISALFPTNHAVGITSSDGAELLIHIGINTVNLNGKYFESHTAEGQKVSKGERLISFDQAAIQKEGYDTTTMVILTNSMDYPDIRVTDAAAVRAGEPLLETL